jgi:hypothetical protein
MPGETRQEAKRLRHGALIFFVALGGAIAWATHLVVIYALQPIACATASGLVIHLMTILFGGVTVGAIVVAMRGRGRPDAGQAERWLATASLLLNGLFLFAILVEGAAAFVVDPCLGM